MRRQPCACAAGRPAAAAWLHDIGLIDIPSGQPLKTCLSEHPSLFRQGGGCGVGGVPALRLGKLPWRGGLGARRGRLHGALLGSGPGAGRLLRVRPAGAPVLHVHALHFLQAHRLAGEHQVKDRRSW